MTTKKEDLENLNNLNPENKNEELTRCEKEREEYLNGWKRAKADLVNYKKEEEERLRQILALSQGEVIKEIIAVLDSFDLGIYSIKEDSPEKKGMTLIRLQLEDVLRKFGLERIKIEKNQPFNPETQECIAVVPGEPSGSVVEEVEKGYFFRGKVLRPARVKVAK